MGLHSALASRAEAGNSSQKSIFDHCSGISMEDGMELSAKLSGNSGMEIGT